MAGEDDLEQTQLLGDVGKLRQILFNLLDNAIKYTQDGAIYLRAYAETRPTAPERVTLKLAVADSGAGIPPDKLDQIFETFVQIDHGGQTEASMGLGLSIASSLVRMLDGELMAGMELFNASM